MVAKKTDLTPAEWSIMRVIWEKKEAIVRDVWEALGEREGWAQTTVRTMMERLARKGILIQKKIDPVCLYKPAVSHEKVLGRTLREMVARMTGSNLADLVAYAVESGQVSERELKELEELIRRKKGERHDRLDK